MEVLKDSTVLAILGMLCVCTLLKPENKMATYFKEAYFVFDVLDFGLLFANTAVFMPRRLKLISHMPTRA